MVNTDAITRCGISMATGKLMWMLEGWEQAKELRQELKEEWSLLWRTKFDDEFRGEDVSHREFKKLFVDRGEIIFASRDFKPLSLREILEQHIGSVMAERVSPDPTLGGWQKFINDHITKRRKQRERPKVKVDLSQHQRKGGHGWLNRAKFRRKSINQSA